MTKKLQLDKVLHFSVGALISLLTFSFLKITESYMNYPKWLFVFLPLFLCFIVGLFKEVFDNQPTGSEGTGYNKTNKFDVWDWFATVLGGATILPLFLAQTIQMNLPNAFSLVFALFFIPAIFVWEKLTEWTYKYKEGFRYGAMIGLFITIIAILVFLAQFQK